MTPGPPHDSTLRSTQRRGAVLITGTSTGIGRVVALHLDREGYRVFAGVRKEVDREKLRREGSERLCPLLLDITVPSQIAAAAAAVRDTLGMDVGLQGLVNNAGTCEAGPVEFMAIERVRRQIDVNLIGHVAVTQAMLPLIRRGRGRIVNITSAAAMGALPLFSAYAASKFGLEGWSDALRRELRWWRIPVSIIEPGPFESSIWSTTAESAPDGGVRDLEDRENLYGEMRAGMEFVMKQGHRAAGDPERIARLIQRILETKRPRARYRCGPGAQHARIFSHMPEFIVDFFIDKIARRRLPTKLMGW